MIDLDRASLERVLPSTPGSADWDEVMSRVRTHRSRRRRRLVVLAASALVGVVGTAAAIGSVRDFILDRGFIGLPPEGATPSAPQSGELVVHWEGWSATLPPVHGGTIVRVWLYADGRIIWDRRSHGDPSAVPIPEGANELTSGYLERRLTREGVQLLRSAVAGLFDRTRTLLETVPADDDPFRRGLFYPDGRLALFIPPGSDFAGSGSLEVPEGDQLVRLQWGGGGAKEVAHMRAQLDGTIATPAQLLALRRVDALLTDPASVLPSSAWAEPDLKAYVPSHYAVCIDTSPPKHSSHLLTLLPARAADLLRDKSRTRLGGEVVEAREHGRTVVLGQAVTYCFKVETAEAREVADALAGLDPEPGWKGYGLAYRVAEPVGNLNPTRIWFEPYFPHGQFTFSGPAG